MPDDSAPDVVSDEQRRFFDDHVLDLLEADTLDDSDNAQDPRVLHSFRFRILNIADPCHYLAASTAAAP